MQQFSLNHNLCSGKFAIDIELLIHTHIHTSTNKIHASLVPFSACYLSVVFTSFDKQETMLLIFLLKHKCKYIYIKLSNLPGLIRANPDFSFKPQLKNHSARIPGFHIQNNSPTTRPLLSGKLKITEKNWPNVLHKKSPLFKENFTSS